MILTLSIQWYAEKDISVKQNLGNNIYIWQILQKYATINAVYVFLGKVRKRGCCYEILYFYLFRSNVIAGNHVQYSHV